MTLFTMSGPHQHQLISSTGQHHHQPQHITIYLNPASTNDDQSTLSVTSAGDTYQMPPAAIPNNDVAASQPQLTAPNSDQKHHQHQQQPQKNQHHHEGNESPQNQQQGSHATRFKWTKEKSQVAMNLVKYGCKPKLVSVAVGCSLRTAQKFVETVTPKMEGESFKNYEIRRRGRKSKDVNQRLNAIREVLSKDCTKTQVEIAADLKVSNTTVCRDLKRIGASWREKKAGTFDGNNGTDSTKKDRQSNVNVKSSNKTRGKQKRKGQQTRQQTSDDGHNNNDDNSKGDLLGHDEPNASNNC